MAAEKIEELVTRTQMVVLKLTSQDWLSVLRPQRQPAWRVL